MNLWILHYSFINHHFHHSTITIKQKITINKLVTELLWGHFLWKNSCSNEKRQIPRKKDEFRGQLPRLNSAVKTHIPRLGAKFRGPRKTVGPTYKAVRMICWGPANRRIKQVLNDCYRLLEAMAFGSYSSSYVLSRLGLWKLTIN